MKNLITTLMILTLFQACQATDLADTTNDGSINKDCTDRSIGCIWFPTPEELEFTGCYQDLVTDVERQGLDCSLNSEDNVIECLYPDNFDPELDYEFVDEITSPLRLKLNEQFGWTQREGNYAPDARISIGDASQTAGRDGTYLLIGTTDPLITFTDTCE